MYFGDTTQPHHYLNGQSHNFNFDNTNAIELLVQQEIQQSQLLSPTQQPHQRHDSMFSSSPSTPKPGVSSQRHQAEPQPYVSTAQPTPRVVAHVPVSMSRSASLYSASSGQQPQHIRQHRVSLDSTSRPSATDMSRSSTQFSSGSAGYRYQAEPQSCGSTSMPNQNYVSTVTAHMPGSFSSNHSSYNTAGTNREHSTYEFDMADAFNANTVDIGSMDSLFGQETTSTE